MPVVRLTEIFRQAQQSAIIRNAHLVNQGIMPGLDNKNKDFFFLPPPPAGADGSDHRGAVPDPSA